MTSWEHWKRNLEEVFSGELIKTSVYTLCKLYIYSYSHIIRCERKVINTKQRREKIGLKTNTKKTEVVKVRNNRKIVKLK
jgi:CTP synthase (UTP-ammonia lyase)